MEQCEDRLLRKGVRPTMARILVTRLLSGRHAPISMNEIETELETLDKSTVSRTLAVLLEHRVVHAFEDGSGSLKYEICRSESDECLLEKRHVHFHCTECQRTFCMNSIKVPVVEMPAGYEVDSINYTIQGVCPECRGRLVAADTKHPRRF